MKKQLDELIDKCAQGSVRVSHDSRDVQAGDIFVAVPGATTNGEDFIPAAIANKSAYIVCRQSAIDKLSPEEKEKCCFIAHDDPREALWRLARASYGMENPPFNIVGITGTNGKTTSAFLLEHVFKSAGYKTAVLGTVNYHWPGVCIPSPLTTPGPLQLYNMLSQMAKSGVDILFMEVSSHALAQQRVNGLSFSGALFTNLTQDHLDFHKDMEDYFRAKARLFLELPKREKAVALNGDDSHGRRLSELLPEALTYGLHGGLPGKAHLQGKIIESGIHGIRMKMSLHKKSWEIHSPLVGAFNALNLLGIQSLALQMGIEPEQFACLESFHGVCGRLERVANESGLNIFVDYAHTPDALVNALKALRASGFEKIVTVFGCGGNRDRAKRPLMGKAVADNSDIAILTSDNPRMEDPQAIIMDVKPGLARAPKVYIEEDRRKATEMGIGLLGPKDALLIAGKGHEDYQIIGRTKIHYSDQEVVKELLNCA